MSMLIFNISDDPPASDYHVPRFTIDKVIDVFCPHLDVDPHVTVVIDQTALYPIHLVRCQGLQDLRWNDLKAFRWLYHLTNSYSTRPTIKQIHSVNLIRYHKTISFLPERLGWGAPLPLGRGIQCLAP